jgi:hypothetical protein
MKALYSQTRGNDYALRSPDIAIKMDVNTFITVISILVAVYALIPRATKLTLSLKMHWLEWSFVILVAAALHYLLFFEFFKRNGLVPAFPTKDFPVNRDEASYILVVLSLSLLIIRFKYFSFPRAKLGQLHKLVEELVVTRGNHAHLVSLFSDNLTKLEKICRGNGLLTRLRRVACRDKYDIHVVIHNLSEHRELPEPKLRFEFPILQNSNLDFCTYLVNRIMNREEDSQSFFPLLQERNLVSLKNGALRMLSVPIRWLPENEERSIQACEILELGLSNREFVTSIAALRPYFALEVLKHDSRISHDFMDLYMSALIQDPTSVFYSELKNNQNIDAHSDYIIPERNKLLGYLFRDTKIAKKFGVWRPIGEAIITDLERRRLESENDGYNFPMHDFQERGCWESEIYVGIRFFDIMVRKAIIQNITDHMWLYYLPHFTEKICANFKATHIDPDSIEEWPSRYSYLLYEIISTLQSWIHMIQDLNVNQENLKIDQEDNGNPIKSSIIALAMCLHDVANCDEISERFKCYLLEISLDLYLKLHRTARTKAYADYMLRILVKGGNWERESPKYVGTLLRAFVFQDNIPYDSKHVIEGMTIITSRFVEKWGTEKLGDYLDHDEQDGTITLKSDKRNYIVHI